MRRLKRRPPKQARARATVADILAATARILEREGYDALTTNAIARVAGVGIGSLYQYFETKEAIVEALQEEHFEKMGEPFLARMEELAHGPIDEMVLGLAALMRSSDLLNSRLSRALLAVPIRGKPNAVVHLEQRVAAILHAYALRVAPRADAARLRIAIYMVVQTVEALILQASQSRPRGLTRQRFTEELAELVLRYLSPILAN